MNTEQADEVRHLCAEVERAAMNLTAATASLTEARQAFHAYLQSLEEAAAPPEKTKGRPPGSRNKPKVQSNGQEVLPIGDAHQ